MIRLIRNLAYSILLVSLAGLEGIPVQAAPVWTFVTVPVTGIVSGPPGATIGWGYEISNQDTENWLVVSDLSPGVFAHATVASIFDFPILPPSSVVTLPYDGVNGLYQLTWDATAPPGFINAGTFVASAEWWSGDPLAGGEFVDFAQDQSAPYTAIAEAAIPEPSTGALALLGVALIASRSLRRQVRTRAVASALLLLIFAFPPAQANAAIIPDRATLDSLLGHQAVTEDFEACAVASGACSHNGILDATTIVNGQGPGLVAAGLQLQGDFLLHWLPAEPTGDPSQRLSALWAQLVIEFTQPTTAFGVDLIGYPTLPMPRARIVVYDRNRYGLSDSLVSLMDIHPSVFFGFHNPAGIGGVIISSGIPAPTTSPAIDNLTFGQAVPELSSLTYLGCGLTLLGSSRKRLAGTK